jgi:hypothetical protein
MPVCLFNLVSFVAEKVFWYFIFGNYEAMNGEMVSSIEWEPFEHQVAGHVYGEGQLGNLFLDRQSIVL